MVDDANIAGAYLQREYRRYYPLGEVAAHVVGFTNVDDEGQEGMELAYHDWLHGEDGAKRVLRDRLGRQGCDRVRKERSWGALGAQVQGILERVGNRR